MRIADFAPRRCLHRLRFDRILGSCDESLNTQATNPANRCAKAPGAATKSSACPVTERPAALFSGNHAVKKLPAKAGHHCRLDGDAHLKPRHFLSPTG